MTWGEEPWNLNIHYDRLLAALAHPGDRVLDIGAGYGFLSARLSRMGCEVVALDADAGVLGRARERWPGTGIAWVHGDVLTHPLPAGGFDLVVSNATLHHLPDTTAALRHWASLVHDGGTVGVVGFARNGPLDWPMSLVGAGATLVLNRYKHKWEHSAPTLWPPPLTYGEVKRVSAQRWPGRSFRRLWLGRYLMTLTKPRAE